MSNIIDYIKWRGDLTFSQDPFNEIDNLILSQLVYVELNNIVSDNAAHAISLLDASKNFFKQNNEQERAVAVLQSHIKDDTVNKKVVGGYFGKQISEISALFFA